MVGGRKVLLSVAVLSGLGFEHVLGGQLGRRDGTVDPVQSATGGVSSSTSTSLPQVATVTTAVAGSGNSTGVPASEGINSSASTSPAVSSSTPQVTVHADVVRTTSTGQDYVYPGAFGDGGTLTTDTNAPVRTDKPTRSSLPPNSGTHRVPPPADTGQWDAPSAGGGRPAPPADDSDYTSTAVTTAAQSSTTISTTVSTTATAAAAAGGHSPPHGGPPKVSTFDEATTETTALGPAKVSTSDGTTDTSLGSGAGAQTQSTNLVTPNPTTLATSTRYENQTFTYSPSLSISYCESSDSTVATTTWSVVYTSTVTWYGDPSEYTQPYPPITIPAPSASCIVPIDPPRFTVSVCQSTGSDNKYKTCETTTTESFGFSFQTHTVPPVVFLTTDKNPAVVYSSINTPRYGVSEEPNTRDNHASPTGPGAPGSTALYNSLDATPSYPDPAHSPTPTPITVAVQPSAVVINGNTIYDNPAQQTQVVVIAGQTFTIDPTHVVGAGATVDRPSATGGGGVYVPTPTSTAIGGVSVVVSASVAVIGGSSFTLSNTTPTTATVSGQTFTLGPSSIAAGTQTLTLPAPPSPSEVVVAGGDLITAIGSTILVVHGTTLTYGPAQAPATTTVDGEAVILGPGGVTLTDAHGTVTTLGGPHAASPQDTQYALVGGATITKVGASVVVIQNHTYTLGPAGGGASGSTITTVVGGQTVTIAPSAVQVGSTLSLGYPFGQTTVITPGATAGGGAASTAGAVGAGGGAEEDAAGLLARPWIAGVAWAVSIAVGVGLML